MNTEPMILSGGGINWTWYAHVSLNADGKAVVHREYRLHRFDPAQGAGQHPKATGYYDILECQREGRRWATGISINGHPVDLDEPRERFSFPK